MENLDHEVMSCFKEEERRHPQERQHLKMHSEEMDNSQMEWIIKRWRTQEKRQYGMGKWEGGGTSDGVRTEACGWFDLSHVCV